MKVPPQDLTAEESILGTLLLEKADVVYEMLKPEDFYAPKHNQVFEAMVHCHMSGDAVDIVSVEDRMKKSGYNVDNHLLPDLTKSASGNIEKLCEIVKEQSIKRTLIEYCNEVMSEAYEPCDAYEVLDKAQELMFSIQKEDNTTLHSIHDTLNSVAEHVVRIQESGEPIGIKTGLDLDDILHGFQDGKLYVLGARPSMGKTALVMTCMRTISKSGKGTGILSLETSNKSLGIRLVSQVSGIPAEKITSGRMGETEMKKFMDACSELSSHEIFIDDTSVVTAQSLRAKCRNLAKKGSDIIFIDFLTLIKSEGRSMHEEVGQTMKVAKQVSKELNIPIVMLAQLSRKVEDRSNKRPQMSDLRESGSIEEDADVILFLYRDEYYGIKQDLDGRATDGVAEIIVSKNKDGKTGVVRQLFHKETMTFKNITEKAPF